MSKESYYGILLHPRSPNCRLASDHISGAPLLSFTKEWAKLSCAGMKKTDPTLKCRVIKVECVYEMPR